MAGMQRLACHSLLVLSVLLVCGLVAHGSVIGLDLGTDGFKGVLIKPGVPMEIVLNGETQRKTPAAVAIVQNQRQFGEEAKTAVKDSLFLSSFLSSLILLAPCSFFVLPLLGFFYFLFLISSFLLLHPFPLPFDGRPPRIQKTPSWTCLDFLGGGMMTKSRPRIAKGRCLCCRLFLLMSCR